MVGPPPDPADPAVIPLDPPSPTGPPLFSSSIPLPPFTSSGEIFSPPRLISSLMRPVNVR